MKRRILTKDEKLAETCLRAEWINERITALSEIYELLPEGEEKEEYKRLLYKSLGINYVKKT